MTHIYSTTILYDKNFILQDSHLKVVAETQKAELSEAESELMMKKREIQTLKSENGVLLKHYQNLKEENRTLIARCDKVSFKHNATYIASCCQCA